MKHPVRDRLLILICALCMLCGAAAIVALLLGKVTLEPVILLLDRIQMGMTIKKQVVLGAAALVLALFGLLMLGITLPARKKRSSSFAIQQNEDGVVRISIKALEALVQRCLNQHAELKVVTSSLFSDEESVRVDVHITLQSDISMPLAISALQKQIKKYLEACSGVVVKEVRVFVDGTTPATEETANSPYAIPASLLGAAQAVAEPVLLAVEEVPADAAVIEVQEETSEEAQEEPEVEIEIVEIPAEEAQTEEEGEQA